MIKMDWCETVAVVAGDAVCSLSKEEFLRRADQVRWRLAPSLSLSLNYW
jgi:hypothetical protein